MGVEQFFYSRSVVMQLLLASSQRRLPTDWRNAGGRPFFIVIRTSGNAYGRVKEINKQTEIDPPNVTLNSSTSNL
jgi:hypothetical protein